jgi:hypothetical protein
LAIALSIAGVISRGRVLRGDSTKPASATGIPAALSRPEARHARAELQMNTAFEIRKMLTGNTRGG